MGVVRSGWWPPLGLPPAGAPWAASASSETGPELVLLPSPTQGTVEVKLGVPQAEPCSSFKMCLLRTLLGDVCAMSEFFSSFLKICRRSRAMVSRSPGTFLVQVLGHGTLGGLPRGLVFESQSQAVSLLADVGGRRSLVLAGEPREPESSCIRGSGALPGPLGPARSWGDSACGLASSRPGLHKSLHLWNLGFLLWARGGLGTAEPAKPRGACSVPSSVPGSRWGLVPLGLPCRRDTHGSSEADTAFFPGEVLGCSAFSPGRVGRKGDNAGPESRVLGVNFADGHPPHPHHQTSPASKKVFSQRGPGLDGGPCAGRGSLVSSLRWANACGAA